MPVLRHWCHKRKYLQGKRGVEKAPWQLPEFIAQTGIEKIRTAVEEQEAMKKAKQKSRERTAPKMAQIDIDYQVRCCCARVGAAAAAAARGARAARARAVSSCALRAMAHLRVRACVPRGQAGRGGGL